MPGSRLYTTHAAAAAAAAVALAFGAHATAAASAVPPPAAPSVFWISNPTLPGETLLIAGDGFDDADKNATVVQLCTDAACAHPVPSTMTDVWSHSAKVTMPHNCGPPCFAQVHAGPGHAIATVAVNAPDVWWSSLHPPTAWATSPSAPTGGSITASPGLALRFFGRSLAWDASGNCVDGRSREASSTTTLSLGPRGPTLAASAANCFEATFQMPPGVPTGSYPAATLSTAWGSVSLNVSVQAAPLPAPGAVTVLDVDASFGGDIAKALAAAAASAHGARVELGAREYALSAPLTVPAMTTMVGQGAASSKLTFTLPAGSNDTARTRAHAHKGVAVNGATPLISGAASNWRLANFSLHIADAPAETAAVYMRANTSNFTAMGLNITMVQQNVSNAFHIEGERFELGHNEIHQDGVCLWPPTSDQSSFTASVSLYLHATRDGYVHDNVGFWACSWMDLDVSRFYVVEDNEVHCINPGTVPHGNSISGYDWHAHPYSHHWSYSRNLMTRPPHNGDTGNHQNWIQRETVTTDGSGAWGTATVTSASGNTMALSWLDFSNAPAPGTVLLGLAGPATGMRATIVSYNAASETVTLDAAVDPWLAVNATVVGVVSDFGRTLIVGNAFVWAEVVQYYGNTVTGVHADNTFTDCNVLSGGGDANGALQGVGECYHGAGVNFFTEFSGNVMNRSDGITVQDNAGPTAEPECKHFHGPYHRWTVVRRNVIDGISDAARSLNATHPPCGGIFQKGDASLPSADVVAEGNTVTCPAPGVMPGKAGTIFEACVHCVEGGPGGR